MKKYNNMMMNPGMFQQRPQPSPLMLPDKMSGGSPYGSHGSGSSGGGMSQSDNMVPFSPADPKPRLRWTPELHERFVDAVTQLGGADSKQLSLHKSQHDTPNDTSPFCFCLLRKGYNSGVNLVPQPPPPAIGCLHALSDRNRHDGQAYITGRDRPKVY